MSRKNASTKKIPRLNPDGPVFSRARAIFSALVLIGLPAALVWHLAHLQVIPNMEKGFAFLQEQGEARTLREEVIQSYRGVITDRNGEILAVSTPVKSIVVNPQRFDLKNTGALAGALGMKTTELAAKIGRYGDKQFMYVARNLPPQDAEKIMALKLDGVSAEQGFQRFYPAGEVAAHVVGFTDIDDRGREGIELALDEWLSGAPGSRRVVKDLKGNVVKDLGVLRAAASGKDVQLSLDLRLQYLAYRELKNAVAVQGAASGSIVMLDAHTGEILAMANQPSYNPNNRTQIQPAQLRNRAITDVIEPGSTMKPFTIVAALESNRYSPGTKIDTNPGHWRVGGKTYSDFKNYGVIDLTTAIQKSSQVAISKLAMDLPPEDLRDVFYRVGMGQPSGTGFPGEALGKLPNPQRWHPTERAALAFGHGLSVTALQLAHAYTVFATGGILRPSSILKVEDTVEGARVMDAKHAEQVMGMLKTVTQPGGTATRAQIKAYPVAGKTGTAHKVGEGGYSDDKYVALFAGLTPVDDPEIVMVVIIHEPPEEHYYGGEAAAPIFAKVAEGSLRLLQVPPSLSLPNQNVAVR
jgi:cell division protein FtsI (penicillin-binding protein 3)